MKNREYLPAKIRALFLLCAFGLVACSEGDEAAKPAEKPDAKPVTKIAEIYYRYAVEAATLTDTSYTVLLNADAVSKGAQCVQNKIVSRGLGLYRQSKLKSLFLQHIFPDELSSYSSFIDDARVQKGAEKRLKDMGFESYAAAVKGNSMITRALLTEYTYYARFREAHDITAGVKPENLVLRECAKTPA